METFELNNFKLIYMYKRIIIFLLIFGSSYSIFGQIGNKLRELDSISIFGLWTNNDFSTPLMLNLNNDGSGEFNNKPLNFKVIKDSINIEQESKIISYKFILKKSNLTISGGDLEGPIIFSKNSVIDSSRNSIKNNKFSNSENGNKFKSTKIGDQIWMAENLNVEVFRNGDTIPEVRDQNTWVYYGKMGKPCWCYYDNDPLMGSKYGKLYNQAAVNDPRGLAPKGWHIATKEEYSILRIKLGLDDTDTKWFAHGFPNISKIISINGWPFITNPEYVGTNESGFNALPGGSRGANDGLFRSKYKGAVFWTSNEFKRGGTQIYIGNFINDNFKYGIFFSIEKECYKGSGASVRCIKD